MLTQTSNLRELTTPVIPDQARGASSEMYRSCAENACPGGACAKSVPGPFAPSRAAWRVPIDRSRRDGAFWPDRRGFQGLLCATVQQGWGKLAPRALGDVWMGVMRFPWSAAEKKGREARAGHERALYIQTPREGPLPPQLVNSRVTASRPPLC